MDEQKIKPAHVFEIIKNSGLPLPQHNIVVDLQKSSGIVLFDANQDREVFDLGVLWRYRLSVLEKPEMLFNSFTPQKPSPYPPLPSARIITTELAECARAMNETLCVRGLEKFAFADSSSSSLDLAVHTAFSFKVQSLLRQGKRPDAELLLASLDSSDYGSCGVAVALGDKSLKSAFHPMQNLGKRIANGGKKKDAWRESLTEAEKLIKKEHNRLAAFVLRAVNTGEGERNTEKEFLNEIGKLCSEYGIPIIADERGTAPFISGELFGFNRSQLKPDIVVFGEPLPIYGILYNKKIATLPTPDALPAGDGSLLRTEELIHAARLLNRGKEEKFDLLSQNIEKMLINFLDSITNNLILSPFVTGTMAYFELPDAPKRERLVSRLEEQGILVGTAGKQAIVIRVPPNVKHEELEKAFSLFTKIISEFSG